MVSIGKNLSSQKKVALPEKGKDAKSTDAAKSKSAEVSTVTAISSIMPTLANKIATGGDFFECFAGKKSSEEQSDSTSDEAKNWNEKEASTLLQKGGSTSNPFKKGKMQTGVSTQSANSSLLDKLNSKIQQKDAENTQSKSSSPTTNNETTNNFQKMSKADVNEYLDNMQDDELIAVEDARELLGNENIRTDELNKIKDKLEVAYEKTGERQYKGLIEEIDKRLEGDEESDSFKDQLEALKNQGKNSNGSGEGMPSMPGGGQAQGGGGEQGGGSGGGEASGGGGCEGGGCDQTEGGGQSGPDGQERLDGSGELDNLVKQLGSDGDLVNNALKGMEQLQNSVDKVTNNDIEAIPKEATQDRAKAESLLNDANNKLSAAGDKKKQANENETEAGKAGEEANKAGEEETEAGKETDKLSGELNQENEKVNQEQEKVKAGDAQVASLKPQVQQAQAKANETGSALEAANTKVTEATEKVEKATEDMANARTNGGDGGAASIALNQARTQQQAAQTKQQSAQEADTAAKKDLNEKQGQLDTAEKKLAEDKGNLQKAETARDTKAQELKNKIADKEKFKASKNQWNNIKDALQNTANSQYNSANILANEAAGNKQEITQIANKYRYGKK